MMTIRMRAWLLAHLPAGVIARPAEWFLAITCLVSGVAIVTGIGEPRSIQALLWPPVFYAWGVSLIFGSIALMFGLTSIHWLNGPEFVYVITRGAAYQLGLRLLGLTSLAYAVAVVIAAGLTQPIAAFLPLAFAAMCGVRLLTVGER